MYDISYGLNFAYWVAEIAMDTLIDEFCKFNLQYTAGVSIILQLILIVVVTTYTQHQI